MRKQTLDVPRFVKDIKIAHIRKMTKKEGSSVKRWMALFTSVKKQAVYHQFDAGTLSVDVNSPVTDEDEICSPISPDSPISSPPRVSVSHTASANITQDTKPPADVSRASSAIFPKKKGVTFMDQQM